MFTKYSSRLISLAATVAVSLSAIATSPAIASAATVNDIGYPFGDCETWYVYQGYQSGSHAGAYAFDLVKGSMSTTSSAGATVVAPATGKIKAKYSINSDGKYKGEGIKIGLDDGTVIEMDHLAEVTSLAVGASISKGTYVAKVFAMPTSTGYSGVSHLHFEYFMPNGSRTPLIHGVWAYAASGPTSGNGVWSGTKIQSPCAPPPPPAPPTTFIGGSSQLYQSDNWNKLNLRVCAANLTGQMVYVHTWRSGRDFGVVGQRASGTCVTFMDMDGAGAMNRYTTYNTQAALNQYPSYGWTVPCYAATGGKGLCDSLRRN